MKRYSLLTSIFCLLNVLSIVAMEQHPLLKTKMVTKLEGHSKPISCVCFSPDGTKFVSASYDGTIKIWNAKSKTCIRTLNDHTKWVKSLSFSPDSTQFVSASYDGKVRLWDVETGTCKKVLNAPEKHRMKFASFSPNGKRVVCVSFVKNKNDCRIISSTRAQIWNIASDERKTYLGESSNKFIKCAFLSSDDKYIVFVTTNEITVVNVESDKQKVLFEGDQGIHCLSLSSQDKYIAFATNAGSVILYDVENESYKTLKGHNSRITSLSFNSKGTLLASASRSGSVKLWDVETGICLKKLTGVNKDIENSVSFNSDDTQLISSKSGKIKLWNIEGIIKAFRSNMPSMTAVANITTYHSYITSKFGQES